MHPKKVFIIVFQEAQPSRNLDLDDLPRHGRFDVVCRTITSCLFLSNSFRKDTTFVGVFENARTMLVIRGSETKHLNPDERSLAGTLREVFSGTRYPGLWYGPGTLKTVLKEFQGWNMLVMDPRGKPISQNLQKQTVFILGDHLGFSSATRQILSSLTMASLGVEVEYLTSQTISILHFLCDKNN